MPIQSCLPRTSASCSETNESIVCSSALPWDQAAVGNVSQTAEIKKATKRKENEQFIGANVIFQDLDARRCQSRSLISAHSDRSSAQWRRRKEISAPRVDDVG